MDNVQSVFKAANDLARVSQSTRTGVDRAAMLGHYRAELRAALEQYADEGEGN